MFFDLKFSNQSFVYKFEAGKNRIVEIFFRTLGARNIQYSQILFIESETSFIVY